MSRPIHVQRIEHCIAVQYEKGDKDAESAIRGWLNLGTSKAIPLHEGTWLVKRRGDNQIYVVENEDFVEEFARVLDEETTEEEAQ